ncbi:MAG: hypothetical protein A3F68_05620 [Acidobacteria bacterium RIFCSPLOWO2_12_FULL_54_10]|nr:MAG: hypothetical protein A3F68_05620 [Acidobacteria bacterium RIFCSPLOWO2_12_FULL_54_10]
MKTLYRFTILVLLLAIAAHEAQAANEITGANSSRGVIAGRVTDARGVAQGGITVNLLRMDGSMVQRVTTQDGGRYRAEGLEPGFYAVEIILPTFLPFWKTPVFIRSGAEFLLDISLGDLSSAVELQWPERPSDAREAWKQVLRNSSRPRPILRFQQQGNSSTPQLASVTDPYDRALHGTVQFRAGNESERFGQNAGLHTTFDMEYDWNDASVMRIAGSGGWERNTPAASFRTALDRELENGGSSSFSATVRQLFLPADYWQSNSATSTDSRVQSVTIGYEEEKRIGERVLVHYGALLDTVSVGDIIRRWSPFGRVTYVDAKNRKLVMEYTAASPRLLPSDMKSASAGVEQWLAIPQISTGADSRPVLEGGSHAEVSWEQPIGPQQRIELAAFYDSLTNLAFSVATQGNGQWLEGTLRDPFSDLYFLSGGDFSSGGVRSAISTKLGENSELIIGYSYAKGLRATSDELQAENAQSVRQQIQPRLNHSATIEWHTIVPGADTQVITSYRWVPSRTVVATDIYGRGMGQANPFLNLIVLQPLPSPEILPGRFQATADFSNILGRGFIPIHLPGGENGYILPSARAFRGGFNFIF